jgi:hypothetical protein
MATTPGLWTVYSYWLQILPMLHRERLSKKKYQFVAAQLIKKGRSRLRPSAGSDQAIFK